MQAGGLRLKWLPVGAERATAVGHGHLKATTANECLEARAGKAVTTVADRDVELTRIIMDVAQHKDVRTVTGYVRRANLFKGRAGSSFL